MRAFTTAGHWLVAVLGLATVYFAGAKLGLLLAVAAEQVSPVWPPTGIALAAVLLWGYRIWPAITLGAFLANVTAHEPVGTACGIAIGNTLEALVGAWLMQWFSGRDICFKRLRDVLGLIVLCAGLSTLISATLGVASLGMGEVHLPGLGRPMQWQDYGWLWRVWWLGDAMGAIVVAPFCLVWAKRCDWLSPARIAEAALLMVGLVLMSWFAFAGGWTSGLGHASLAYAIFPFIIWAAVRFGQHGTTAVALLSSALTIWATAQAHAPHAIATHQQLLSLQAFLGVVATTGLLLGAALQERRQAEAHVAALNSKLHRRVEELQALLDVLPVGVFIAQDASCEVITANPAGAAMLDIKPGVNASKTGPAAEQLPFRVLKNGIEVPGDELPMQRAVRTGLPVAGEEFEIVRGDGTKLTLFEYASPLFDEKGNVRGCLGAFVDITDRQRAEQALREADRRKDEFLAMLAHELRNPLAPLRNGLEIMNRVHGDDDLLADARQMMERQMKQLVRLVDDLLDVSRITRDKLELRKQRIELAPIVRQAVETCGPLADADRQTINLALPNERIYLEADAIRLAQVFSNLLNNACKYSPQDSTINVSITREGSDVVICFKDSGVGIPPEMLSQVFEMFTQIDQSLERAKGGLGIGLTLVKRLVEMHGGSVTAQSEGSNRGSEFNVRLPILIETPPSVQEVASPLASMQTRDRRILVVDDNHDAAASLAMLLRLTGSETIVAHDGVEAVEKASTYRPHVVLLDIGLPKMNGYDVCRTIRQQAWGRDIVLVALTGWGQEEDRRRATEAGFDGHLVKPVDHGALEQLLSGLLPVESTA